MRRTVTTILSIDPHAPDAAAIAVAAACLRDGGLVAFPTETVYGLGVHALDATAVRRLFDAKGRPATDPLIVHVTSASDVATLAVDVPEAFAALAERFWPGPLTMVLRRAAVVPGEVTAGLDTVAVRVPAHPIARALIAAAAIPVAAPSANLFSRPSPTQAAHVLEDLDGRIDIVIDGGATDVGVESTVLDLASDVPTVLRPGAVTLEMLRPLLPDVRLHQPTGDGDADGAAPQRAPGLLSRHYSPRAPLTLYEGPASAVLRHLCADARAAAHKEQQTGLLLADEDVCDVPGAHVVRFGPEADPARIATRLYAALREFDLAGVDVIFARGVDGGDGLGTAISDRLRRAAAGRIVRCGESAAR